ncbi:MAG: hypothetical protein GX442_10835 [Candidatus Riflebacteria bacterium]|nr:hypothetical protein [Candidatus Riflebacteria bacterium]
MPEAKERVGVGGLVLVALFLGFPVLIMVGMSIERRGQEPLQRCGWNLRSIASAIEMYNLDHPGTITDLSLLVPDYLKADALVCPAAGRDTYSGSFACKAAGPDGKPEITVFCQGGNHTVFDHWSFLLPVFRNLVDEPSFSSSGGIKCSKVYHGFTD